MVTFAHKPIISGDRIVLRPLVGTDADAMWADAQDEEINHFTGTHADFERDMVLDPR